MWNCLSLVDLVKYTVYYACMLKAGHETLVVNLQSTSGVLRLGSVHVALVKLPKLSYSTTKNPFAVGVS